MKVYFANGTEIEVYQVLEEPRFINGQSRDSLTFIMPDNYSMDEVDTIFTESACEVMNLVDEGGEYLHKGYTIRCELKKEKVTVSTNADNPREVTEDVVEDRIFVTMARRTYNEEQVKVISDEITNTQLALCEVYELMV